MNNSSNTINWVKKISLTDTLLSIRPGESILVPAKIAKTTIVRNTVWRLKRRMNIDFSVSEAGLVNETKVTRIR